MQAILGITARLEQPGTLANRQKKPPSGGGLGPFYDWRIRPGWIC